MAVTSGVPTTIVGAAPASRAARSAAKPTRATSSASAVARREALVEPLIVGTWLTTARTRASVAASTSTCPPL